LLLIVRAILQNRRDVDCGCSFGPAAGHLGAFQLARNATLALLAAGTWLADRGGGVAISSSQILAGTALLALYGALDQVMGLKPLRTGEIL
jgi:hypothetical protein